MARQRLAFDEMLRVAIKIEKQSLERSKQKSQKISVNKELHKKFLKSLPYTLTKDQNKAIKEIYEDINKLSPMNRLLNGDVGMEKQ